MKPKSSTSNYSLRSSLGRMFKLGGGTTTKASPPPSTTGSTLSQLT